MPRPDPAPLTVHAVELPDRTLVTVAGEIDLGTAPVLRETLVRLAGADEVRDLALDMAGVTFVDSSGLAVLLMGARRWEAAERSYVLKSPSRQVRRIVELTGAQALLAFED